MIHVVSRIKSDTDSFIRNHVNLYDHITIEEGYGTSVDLLNRLIQKSIKPHICLVHDDTWLPDNFNAHIEQLVSQLDQCWPNWGIAGNAGIIPMQAGYSANDTVRYLVDSHGGPNLSNHILPAQSIDGNIILLNIPALRNAGVKLPSFNGIEKYDVSDVILSVETIMSGLGVYVASELSCVHKNKRIDGIYRRKLLRKLNGYLGTRLNNNIVKTLYGHHNIKSRNNIEGKNGIDLDMHSLRAAAKKRKMRSVAIVTRTLFTRNELLKRTLESITEFIAASGSSTEFKSYIVTNSIIDAPEWAYCNSFVLKYDIPNNTDMRYHLVRFAAENIKADYFWFIDDDDWLFSDEAERLSLIVNVSPKSSIIFIGSQHFKEDLFAVKRSIIRNSFPFDSNSYFPPKRFMASLTGSNFIPFCGVLYDRDILLSIPYEIYDTVKYYEDYVTMLFAVMVKKQFPVVVDKLFTGISIRASGNAVTEIDRSKWDKSLSNVISCILNTPEILQLNSLLPELMGNKRTKLYKNYSLIIAKLFQNLSEYMHIGVGLFYCLFSNKHY
jgi:hypothetical protein